MSYHDNPPRRRSVHAAVSTKERPILFSGEMVRAILDGRKTQTRRLVKNLHADDLGKFQDPALGLFDDGGLFVYESQYPDEGVMDLEQSCPYGQPGDRLWVRETWAPMCRHADPYCSCGSEDEEEKPYLAHDGHYVEYRADTGNRRPGDWPDPTEDEFQDAPTWKPSIHMPRWASRITLEITGVRVERLQEISRGDAMAEGCPFPNMAKGDDPRDWFAGLWDSINAERAPWASNPWVWAIEFKRLAAEPPAARTDGGGG